MFDKKMKSSISKAIQLGLEKGLDIEKSVFETLELAEKGELPNNLKSNSAPVVKTFEIKQSEVDLENRIVSGYAATWDLDQVDDIIHPGAFKKSINERLPANKIKVLSQHDVLIGKPIEMYEDEKGLFVRAYISPTTQGNNDLQLVKDGVLDRFSIGFSIPGGKYEIDEKGIRHIYEVKLMEFSLVTFPANEEAIVMGVKESFEEQIAKMNADHLNQSKSEEPEIDEDEEQLKKSFEEMLEFIHEKKSKDERDKEIEKSIKEMFDFTKNFK